MRAWLEAGYLSADLPICNTDPRRGPFRKLSEFFPNAVSAFLPPEQSRTAGAQAPAKEGEWFFVDKNNKVQGPFSDIHMRQWHLAGYFEPTLMLMNRALPNAQWMMLRDLFPSIADAFLVGVGAQGAGGAAGGAVAMSNANRFEFPEWLPVPPRFRGVKKTYPSETKSGNQRKQVNITDVNGRTVETFSHAR